MSDGGDSSRNFKDDFGLAGKAAIVTGASDCSVTILYRSQIRVPQPCAWQTMYHRSNENTYEAA